MRSAWLRVGVWVAGIGGLVWGLKALGLDLTRLTPDDVRHFVLSFGVWAPLIYLAVFSQPVVPLPASVMMIAGGLAFGPLWGTLGASGAATLRACGSFALARRLGRATVSRLLKGRLADLDGSLSRRSFQTVLVLRLVPSVPFDVMNYGLGCSGIRFWPYASATAVALVPISFVFVYLGHSLTDFGRVWKVLLAIVLLAALIHWQRWYARRRSALAPAPSGAAIVPPEPVELAPDLRHTAS